MNTPKLPERYTTIHTWFERDRQHVELRTSCGLMEDTTIVEWWDEDVTSAVEDGFLEPKDWHGSAYEYAVDHNLLPDVPACGVHYIRMNGEHGCIPDSIEVYRTRENALEYAKELFGLGRTRLAILKRDGILSLRPQDGAAYVSVELCECGEPWEHFESLREYMEQFGE